MIFFRFSKKSGFGVFLVHPTMVSVLLSALVERCFVSRMRDFFKGVPQSAILFFNELNLITTVFNTIIKYFSDLNLGTVGQVTPLLILVFNTFILPEGQKKPRPMFLSFCVLDDFFNLKKKGFWVFLVHPETKLPDGLETSGGRVYRKFWPISRRF